MRTFPPREASATVTPCSRDTSSPVEPSRGGVTKAAGTALSRDSVTAVVTAARLAPGDGHEGACQPTAFRERAPTLLDPPLAKV